MQVHPRVSGRERGRGKKREAAGGGGAEYVSVCVYICECVCVSACVSICIIVTLHSSWMQGDSPGCSGGCWRRLRVVSNGAQRGEEGGWEGGFVMGERSVRGPPSTPRSYPFNPLPAHNTSHNVGWWIMYG